MSRKPSHPATLAAQALGSTDASTGAVVLPIHTATTFLRDPDNQYRRGRSIRASERRVFASSAANIATRPTRSSRFKPRSRVGCATTARRRGRNLRCKSSYMSWLIIDSARNLRYRSSSRRAARRARYCTSSWRA